MLILAAIGGVKAIAGAIAGLVGGVAEQFKNNHPIIALIQLVIGLVVTALLIVGILLGGVIALFTIWVQRWPLGSGMLAFLTGAFCCSIVATIHLLVRGYPVRKRNLWDGSLAAHAATLAVIAGHSVFFAPAGTEEALPMSLLFGTAFTVSVVAALVFLRTAKDQGPAAINLSFEERMKLSEIRSAARGGAILLTLGLCVAVAYYQQLGAEEGMLSILLRDLLSFDLPTSHPLYPY